MVEASELIQTVIASAVAGVGVTVSFSIAIWGAARFVDLSGAERSVAAGGAALIGILGLAVTISAVVFGLVSLI